MTDLSPIVRWSWNEEPSRESALIQLRGQRLSLLEQTVHALLILNGIRGRATPLGKSLLNDVFNNKPPCFAPPDAKSLAKAVKTICWWFHSQYFDEVCYYSADEVFI